MIKAQEHVLAPSSHHPHHCSTSYFLLFFPSLSSMKVVVLCFQLQLLLTLLYPLPSGVTAHPSPLLIVSQGEAENLQESHWLCAGTWQRGWDVLVVSQSWDPLRRLKPEHSCILLLIWAWNHVKMATVHALGKLYLDPRHSPKSREW